MKFRLGLVLVAMVSMAAAGCGDDDEPTPPSTGSIGVTTVSTGDAIDDGYQITVDGENAGTIGANSQVVVTDVTPGDRDVGLTDVEFNCTVGGDNPRTVAVTAGETETTQFDVTCVAPNQPPVADAGEDQTLQDPDGSGFMDVTLDGSGSTDPDGTITNYSWTVDGDQIAAGQMPRTAFLVGEHEVVLTVTDNDGASDTDIVMIVVEAFVGNQSPVADAGDNQTVTDADNSGSEDVTLDGTGSMDPDGTIATYSWSENSVEIATGATPTVTFAVGAHTVTLTVTDDEGATDTDDVIITVNAPTVFFSTDILPYFEAGQANCVQCHNGGTGSAGVNLDTYAGVTGTGDNGPLVVPGDSSDPSAILLPRVLADHFDGPDDATFAGNLAIWIDEGALDN